ncbi:MAG TPA: hypothetical protein VIV11_42485 [Kofleriaceae bacterium]
MLRLSLSLISLVFVALCATPAFADAKADHAALADAANKLSQSAANLAKAAKGSDDRGARKKFAPAAQDLSDDLAAFGRRAAKDVPFKQLGGDAAAILKDSGALVELADEAEDKEERKSLRNQAQLIQQGVANLGKQLLAAAANEDKGSKPADTAPKRFTGRLFNNTDKCDWPENVFFQLSRNGQVVFKTQLVFPGKNFALALEEGQYLVSILETNGDFLAQKTLDAKTEGWQLVSGCIKD